MRLKPLLMLFISLLLVISWASTAFAVNVFPYPGRPCATDPGVNLGTPDDTNGNFSEYPVGVDHVIALSAVMNPLNPAFETCRIETGTNFTGTCTELLYFPDLAPQGEYRRVEIWVVGYEGSRPDIGGLSATINLSGAQTKTSSFNLPDGSMFFTGADSGIRCVTYFADPNNPWDENNINGMYVTLTAVDNINYQSVCVEKAWVKVYETDTPFSPYYDNDRLEHCEWPLYRTASEPNRDIPGLGTRGEDYDARYLPNHTPYVRYRYDSRSLRRVSSGNPSTVTSSTFNLGRYAAGSNVTIYVHGTRGRGMPDIKMTAHMRNGYDRYNPFLNTYSMGFPSSPPGGPPPPQNVTRSKTITIPQGQTGDLMITLETNDSSIGTYATYIDRVYASSTQQFVISNLQGNVIEDNGVYKISGTNISVDAFVSGLEANTNYVAEVFIGNDLLAYSTDFIRVFDQSSATEPMLKTDSNGKWSGTVWFASNASYMGTATGELQVKLIKSGGGSAYLSTGGPNVTTYNKAYVIDDPAACDFPEPETHTADDLTAAYVAGRCTASNHDVLLNNSHTKEIVLQNLPNYTIFYELGHATHLSPPDYPDYPKGFLPQDVWEVVWACDVQAAIANKQGAVNYPDYNIFHGDSCFLADDPALAKALKIITSHEMIIEDRAFIGLRDKNVNYAEDNKGEVWFWNMDEPLPWTEEFWKALALQYTVEDAIDYAYNNTSHAPHDDTDYYYVFGDKETKLFGVYLGQ